MAAFPERLRRPLSWHQALPWEAALALCVTAVTALVWSHYKVIWFDEWLEMLTDRPASLGHVLHIQRRYPVVLDPALFHIVDHLSIRLFGSNALAMRLPSLFGFLLAQASLFVFVRRIAGRSAGLLALVLPAVSGMLLYAVEARPYGLLCGLFGVSLPLYQQATRSALGSARIWALVALSVVIGAAINLHWFGVFILLPLCTAELARLLVQRRLNRGTLLSVAAGAACLLFALPFRSAAARYSAHYFAHATTAFSPRLPLLWYREVLFGYVTAGSMHHSLIVVLPVLFASALALALYSRSSGLVHLPWPELSLVLCLTLLPFFAYAVSLVLHQTVAMRYVLAAGLGVAALAAIALAPVLQVRAAPAWLTPLLLLAVVANGALQIHRERVGAAHTFSTMRFSPSVDAALRNAPGNAIYMANAFRYAVDVQYTPDPVVQHKLTLLYSFQEEMALRGTDTNALLIDNLRHFTSLPIARYEDVRTRGGRAIFIVSPETWWDWPTDALQKDRATLRELGDAFGGKVMEVSFPSATPAKQQP